MKRGILASREELCSLKDRLGHKPFEGFYEVLRSRCSLILEAAPITEAHWRQAWQQGQWAPALTAARTAQGRILDLLIAHHIDRNPAFRDRAIEELKDLAAWSTWVDPCYKDMAADLCTAEAAVAAAVALDWLWEDLAAADRDRAIQAVRTKAIAPYCQAVAAQASWYACYHSWNAVINSGCGLAGLALSDEDPQAARAYKLARTGLKHFFDALGRDGGWDEGTGYWGTAMRYVVLLGEAASRLADDQSIFHQRGMDATGSFPAYFCPNGRPAGFGEAAVAPLHGTLYLLAGRAGNKDIAWWLDTYAFHCDVTTTGWSAAGMALLMRPKDLPVATAPDLPLVKVFQDIGWAALADRWPRPGFYVAAKTGDLAASHAQHDMNAIQLQVDGETLLTDLGHSADAQEQPPGAPDGFYEVWARAHNTIVLGANDHQIDAQGAIVDSQAGKNFRAVACDAGMALGDGARFLRHAVMVLDADQAGRTLIVLDELEIAVPEIAEMFWHCGGLIDLNDQTAAGTIAGRRSTLHFALAASVQFTVKSETRLFQPSRADRLLHLRAGVVGKTWFLSAFSRDNLAGQLQLRQTDSGVQVVCGRTRLDFAADKARLALAKVTAE